MARSVSFGNSANRCRLRQDISFGTDDFHITIVATANENVNWWRLMGDQAGTSTLSEITINSSGLFTIKDTGGVQRQFSSGLAPTAINKIEFIRVGNTLEGKVNDTSYGTIDVTGLSFGNLGCFNENYNGTGSEATWVFNSATFERAGTLIHKYEANYYGNSNRILVDQVGNNPGRFEKFGIVSPYTGTLDSFSLADSINPTDWVRKVELTEIATTAVSSDFYVAYINENNLPAEVWSYIESDGGDLRVCLNEDGTNALPIDVAYIDVASQHIDLFVRVPMFVSGISLWLFYNKPGSNQPAAFNRLGKHGTWIDFALVMHGLQDISDSTGYMTGTINNGGQSPDPVTYSRAKGVYLHSYNRVRFENIPLSNTHVSVGALAEVATYSGYILGSSGIQGASVFTTRITDNEYSPSLGLVRDSNQACQTYYFADRSSLAAGSDIDGNTSTTNTPYVLDGTFNRTNSGKTGGTWVVSKNSAVSSNNSVSLGAGSLAGNSFNTLGEIGAHARWGNYPTMHIKFFQLTTQPLSTSYLTTKDTNFRNTSTFWSTGTPQNTVAGSTNVLTSPIISGDSSYSAITEQVKFILSVIFNSAVIGEALNIGKSTVPEDISSDTFLNVYELIDKKTYMYPTVSSNLTTVDEFAKNVASTLSNVSSWSREVIVGKLGGYYSASAQSLTSQEYKTTNSNINYSASSSIQISELISKESLLSLSVLSSISTLEQFNYLVNAATSSTTSNSTSLGFLKSISATVDSSETFSVVLEVAKQLLMGWSSDSSINTLEDVEKAVLANISSVQNFNMYTGLVRSAIMSLTGFTSYTSTEEIEKITSYISNANTDIDTLYTIFKTIAVSTNSTPSISQTIEINKALNILMSSDENLFVVIDSDEILNVLAYISISSDETLDATQIVNKAVQLDSIVSSPSLDASAEKITNQILSVTATPQYFTVQFKGIDQSVQTSSSESMFALIDISKELAEIYGSSSGHNITVSYNKELDSVEITSDGNITTVINATGSDSLRNIIKVPLSTKVKERIVKNVSIVHDEVLPIRTIVINQKIG